MGNNNRTCGDTLRKRLVRVSMGNVGIDDWMSDFLMNGREFWVEHHPESLSVEYPDVIIGLPRADRYKELLHYMEEAVGNSRFDGACYELSYVAYRCAVEKSKR